MIEKNKVYAVIDTNVVVSAFFSKNGTSNPALVIGKILDKVIIPVYNEEILSEYREVLSRTRFSFSQTDIDKMISAFKEFGISVERTSVCNEEFPDPDDLVFYEVKMSVDDSYLVTGNLKHFPNKPFVVTPAQMIEILNKKGL